MYQKASKHWVRIFWCAVVYLRCVSMSAGGEDAHEEHDEEHDVSSESARLSVVDPERGLLADLRELDVDKVDVCGGSACCNDSRRGTDSGPSCAESSRIATSTRPDDGTCCHVSQTTGCEGSYHMFSSRGMSQVSDGRRMRTQFLKTGNGGS